MKRMYISALLIAVLSSQMQAWVTPFIVMANEAYKARSVAVNAPVSVENPVVVSTPTQPSTPVAMPDQNQQLQQQPKAISTFQPETIPTQVTNTKPFIAAAAATGATIAAALLARKPAAAIAAAQTVKTDVATSYKAYQAAQEYFAELYQAVAKTKAAKTQSAPLLLPAPSTVKTSLFKCDAPGCNAIYSLKNSLKKHKGRMHPSQERKEFLTCCGHTYLDGYHLERHRTSVKHLMNKMNNMKKA